MTKIVDNDGKTALGPVPFVILTSTPAILEAFITKGNDFAGRFAQPSCKLICTILNF